MWRVEGEFSYYSLPDGILINELMRFRSISAHLSLQRTKKKLQNKKGFDISQNQLFRKKFILGN